MAPHSPDPLGLLLAATIATTVVTSALSLLVSWRHHRAVGRSVRSRAAAVPVAPVPVGGRAAAHHRARPVPVVVLGMAQRPAARSPANDPWRRARRRLHATVAAYVVAGLACGLVDGAGAGRGGTRGDRAAQPARPGCAVRLAARPDRAGVLAAPRSTRIRPGSVTACWCRSRRSAPGSRRR